MNSTTEVSSASTSKIFLSTTTSPSDDQQKFVTGRVKFYRREQAYGFIIPDDETIAKEVFVHRTALVTSEKDEFEPWPFLWRNDRVKFTTEHAEGKGAIVAKNVTLEDGTIVPNRRKLLVSRFHTKLDINRHQLTSPFISMQIENPTTFHTCLTSHLIFVTEFVLL